MPIVSRINIRSGRVIRCPRDDEEEGGQSGKAQAADQHQGEDDCVSEGGPVFGGALNRQTCNRDRGGGGEECHLGRGHPTVVVGYRKGQEQTTDYDQTAKAVEQDEGRGEVSSGVSYGGALGDRWQQLPEPGPAHYPIAHSFPSIHCHRQLGNWLPLELTREECDKYNPEGSKVKQVADVGSLLAHFSYE